MGCSHSKRNQHNIKKKFASVSMVMDYREQRQKNPNSRINTINMQIKKSPFPVLKPTSNIYQSRVQKAILSKSQKQILDKINNNKN